MQKATGLSNLIAVDVNHCYGAQAVSLVFPDGFKFSYSGDCRPSNQFAITGKGSTVLVHEATFDDALAGDAEAKKHSTTSEAIGVGAAMGAKRVLLTHFSQRYQKIPSAESMKSVSVRLEDTGAHEDPTEGMDPPVNAEDEPLLETPASALESKETFVFKDAQNTGRGAMEPRNEKTIPTGTDEPIGQAVDDMKIGVAFDYMRVKVGDIIHLEKFNPALSELYKVAAKEEADGKAKKASKETLTPSEQAHKCTPESKKIKEKTKRTIDAQKEAPSTPRSGRKTSNSKASPSTPTPKTGRRTSNPRASPSPPPLSVPVEPQNTPNTRELEDYRRRYQKLESPTRATTSDTAPSGL